MKVIQFLAHISYTTVPIEMSSRKNSLKKGKVWLFTKDKWLYFTDFKHELKQIFVLELFTDPYIIGKEDIK